MELLRSHDPRLQIVAGKVLINMDAATRKHGILNASVYQLNPTNRPTSTPVEHRVSVIHLLIRAV